ncbi:Nn.00g012130.m01.CDS01 [Neocucurbitaria sp. VM-36]
MSAYFPNLQQRRPSTSIWPAGMNGLDQLLSGTAMAPADCVAEVQSQEHFMQEQPLLNHGFSNDTLPTPAQRSRLQSSPQLYQTSGRSYTQEQPGPAFTNGYNPFIVRLHTGNSCFANNSTIPDGQTFGPNPSPAINLPGWTSELHSIDPVHSQWPLLNAPQPFRHAQPLQVPQLPRFMRRELRYLAPRPTPARQDYSLRENLQHAPDFHGLFHNDEGFDGASDIRAIQSSYEDWSNPFPTRGPNRDINAQNDAQQDVGSFNPRLPTSKTPESLSPSGTNFSEHKKAVPKGGTKNTSSLKPTASAGEKVGKKRGRKSRKSTVVHGPQPQLRSSGLYFSSLQHARQEVKGLMWDPRPDNTLPTSQKEREVIVQELFDSMQDVSAIQDKKTNMMLQKRWLGIAEAKNVASDQEAESAETNESDAAQATATDEVYKPWVKEKIYWELLDIAERIYVEGTGFISIHDPATLQECERWRELTFRERIDKLIQVCKEYKSRVDKMLRGGVLEEYVLCPDMLLKNSKNNRLHNDVRKEDIAEGRKRAGRPPKKTRAAGEFMLMLVYWHG